MAINRQYKNSVFTLLFNDPGTLRELYGAIRGVELPPGTPVVINTLENVLAMTYINDISFTIDNRLIVLAEHQSTVNPNMPLRFLLYVAGLYKKEVVKNEKELYGRKRLPIPQPEFIVLYNGKAPAPDYEAQKLSLSYRDAAALGADPGPSLELTVKVYNINAGRNAEILARCAALGQYSAFIAKARECGAEKARLAEGEREAAIRNAVEWCIRHDILKAFLTKHFTEVVTMLTQELTIDDIVEVQVRDAREEGVEKGRGERGIEIARNLLAKGLPLELVQETTSLDTETLQNLGAW